MMIRYDFFNPAKTDYIFWQIPLVKLSFSPVMIASIIL